jgi:hypothetical protein
MLSGFVRQYIIIIDAGVYKNISISSILEPYLYLIYYPCHHRYTYFIFQNNVNANIFLNWYLYFCLFHCTGYKFYRQHD